MENHIETNFREIQKILDSCVSHGYKTKVDALFLKREYLTQAQLKDISLMRTPPQMLRLVTVLYM